MKFQFHSLVETSILTCFTVDARPAKKTVAHITTIICALAGSTILARITFTRTRGSCENERQSHTCKQRQPPHLLRATNMQCTVRIYNNKIAKSNVIRYSSLNARNFVTKIWNQQSQLQWANNNYTAELTRITVFTSPSLWKFALTVTVLSWFASSSVLTWITFARTRWNWDTQAGCANV